MIKWHWNWRNLIIKNYRKRQNKIIQIWWDFWNKKNANSNKQRSWIEISSTKKI